MSKSNPQAEPASEDVISEKKDGVHPPRSMLKNLVLIGTYISIRTRDTQLKIFPLLSIASHPNPDAVDPQTANTTAVFISLPTIGEDLNISESNLQWVISAYALSS
ncbi:hypothetical protein K466DRAFT_570167, partial [Polyporus arcularius HHB13444]